MAGFLGKLLEKPFWVILSAAGIILVVLSRYTISGKLSQLSVMVTSFNLPFVAIGIALIAAGIAMYLFDAGTFGVRMAGKITAIEHGFETIFRQNKVSILFGKFEKLTVESKAVVVLPSSQRFDKACLYDVKTVAGAFLRENYETQEIEKIVTLHEDQLAKMPRDPVVTESGVTYEYYGGTCIYVEPGFGPVRGLLFGATTCERKSQGSRADLAWLFKALDEVRCVVVDNRISRLYVPLLGAGRGGLSPELSYLLILAGLLQAKASEGGGSIGDIGIVVYQPDGTRPQLSRNVAKHGLRRLLALYSAA